VARNRWRRAVCVQCACSLIAGSMQSNGNAVAVDVRPMCSQCAVRWQPLCSAVAAEVHPMSGIQSTLSKMALGSSYISCPVSSMVRAFVNPHSLSIDFRPFSTAGVCCISGQCYCPSSMPWHGSATRDLGTPRPVCVVVLLLACPTRHWRRWCNPVGMHTIA